MADDFERRFRTQVADVFQTGTVSRVWADIGLAYLRFSDANSNPRLLDQQLLNVLNRDRRDGVFVPWKYVLADAAGSGTLAYRRGYTLAKMLVERPARRAFSSSAPATALLHARVDERAVHHAVATQGEAGHG